MRIRKNILAFAILAMAGWLFVTPVQAANKMGMHVLHPQEFSTVAKMYGELRSEETDPIYITIPFTLDDVDRLDQWQEAFSVARKENLVPIVRLSTRMDANVNGWAIPSKRDIVRLANALDQLDWPQTQRYIVVFNEPNHAGEWGGTLDPDSFADMTEFALDWFHTEDRGYVMLPAALDLAAANTATTQEAFRYWKAMLQRRPDILDKIDAWNSHSYPNPGFMASPTASGQNSMRGYQHELAFVKRYTDRQLPVFITETGWLDRLSSYRLQANYDYALRHIWSDDQVVAVTPFVLAGSPGPFAEFSFVDESGEPTRQWFALAAAVERYQKLLLTQR